MSMKIIVTIHHKSINYYKYLSVLFYSAEQIKFSNRKDGEPFPVDYETTPFGRRNNQLMIR